MPHRIDLPRLIGRCHASPHEREGWATLLDEIVGATGSLSGVMFFTAQEDEATRAPVSSLFPADALGCWTRDWAADDPWIQGLSTLDRGRFFPGEAVISQAAFRRTDVYHHFASQLGIEHACGATLSEIDGIGTVSIAMQQTGARGTLEADTLAALDAIVPHLQHALQIAALGGPGTGDADRIRLEHIEHAALVCDETLWIRARNAAAERVLGAVPGLVHGADRLRSPVIRNEPTLRSCIAAACRAERYRRVLRLPTTLGAMTIRIGAWQPGPALFAGHGGRALVVLDDSVLAPWPRRDALQASLGLTDREADVCRFVALGWSIKEIASELALSTNTVRIHVSSILEKTGARDRMRLLARLQNLGRVIGTEPSEHR